MKLSHAKPPVGEPGAGVPREWVGPPLDAATDRALLRLARRAMEAEVLGTPLQRDDIGLPSAASQKLGAFVTLTIDGDLRGCMGRLDFERPLLENLLASAVAVTRDPRFEPLDPSELALVRVEISVIAPPTALPDPADFDPQRHGIIVERGWRHAVLLPQVAQERGWDGPTTLGAVCQKAGLDADAWRRSDTTLAVFVTHSAYEPVPGSLRSAG